MRVVLLVASPVQGGMEKHVIELANTLATLAHEVVLIADTSYAPHLHTSVQLTPFNYQRSRHNPLMLLSLLRTLKALNADIIHCHGSKASQMVSLLRPLLHVPVVATVHGIKKRLGFLTHFDAAIGVSHHITQMLPQQCHAVTIYNGLVPPDILSQAERAQLKQSLGLPESDFLWVTVGRLAPVKGIDLLIQAMPQVEGHLLIVGDGPDRAALEHLVQTLGLSARITFAGHRDDAQQLLQCADQVVISSLREGFSYVFLEAMLSKTPVIATDVPVANEILPLHCLCKTGDRRALAELMQHAQTSPSDLSTVMAKCSASMTLDNMAKSVETLYQQVISGEHQAKGHG